MKRRGRRIAISAMIIGLLVSGLATLLAWSHLLFWYRFAPLGLNAQGYREYRHRQTGIVFVRLPGGKFWMGAQRTDPTGRNYDPEAEDDEGPVHEVALGPFLIGKNEVTQAKWQLVMGSNPSNFKGDDNRPVELISGDEIKIFEARTMLRLPTEAQWEYACRAGSSTPFAGTGKLDDMGWFDGNSSTTTHPVGQKIPNQFGLHDTYGNVCEVCEDVFDVGFYGKPLARVPDPVSNAGPDWSWWVTRGGSCYTTSQECRSAARRAVSPPFPRKIAGRTASGRATDQGFRPAYRLP